jgi:hypothetical protein
LKDYFNMSAFFDGQNQANNFLEAKKWSVLLYFF